MKDKDFDDIGKRLYDLEADPPKNGWKKIASAVNTSGPTGKVLWLRKNWWKPLIIVVPLGAYVLYSVQQSNNLSEAPSKKSTITERLPEGEGVQSISDAPPTEDQSGDTTVPEEVYDPTSPPANERTLQTDNVTINKNPNDGNAQSLTRRQGFPMKRSTEPFSKDDSKETDAQYNDVDRLTTDSVTDAALISKTEKGEIINNHEEKLKVGGHPDTDDRIMSSQQNATIDRDDTNANVIATSQDGVSDQSSNNRVTSPLGGETAVAIASIPVDTTNAPEPAITLSRPQSTEVDSAAATEIKNEDSEKIMGKWRITISLTPQYISKLVRPVASDEVLVTGVNRSSGKPRIGLSFAAGAGISIADNLYLDAQLSYAETQQDIFFSYATGNIDTLLAVQQPDQSVRVTPVYEISQREISSKYGYAGIRLGATRYFWSTPRRRFNISAMVGTHYLVSADVKEKRNGNWVALKNEDLNNVNYSLMFGAGYNVNLSRGWELMINPAFTYYLRKVKNNDLPYEIDHQSFGLHFMLSKALGRK